MKEEKKKKSGQKHMFGNKFFASNKKSTHRVKSLKDFELKKK